MDLPRYKDKKAKYLVSSKHRIEDSKSKIIFSIKIIYRPDDNEADIFFKDGSSKKLFGSADLPIYNPDNLHYIINNNGIKFDASHESACLKDHTHRVKTEKTTCRFLDHKSKICSSWLNCIERQWDENQNIPICKFFKNKIIVSTL